MPMDIELDWGSFLSTAGGGGAVLLMFKALLTKALRDLELLRKGIDQVVNQLSVLDIKVERLEKLYDKVQAHDLQISKLEARIEHEHEARIHGLHKGNFPKGVD